MQPRQRYLALRIYSSENLPSEADFRNAIWQQLTQLYGELGVSLIGFWLTSYHPDETSAILRCQHTQVRPLRAALATLTHVNSKPLLIHVVAVSGTIRKAVSHLPELETGKVIRARKHR
ncbi:MAG: Rpp14/Pop5 family protein [Promethearchaeota archaeon]